MTRRRTAAGASSPAPRRLRVFGVGIASLALGLGASGVFAVPAGASTTEAVIVTAHGPTTAAGAVSLVAGSVLDSYSFVHSVKAEMTPASRALLGSIPGITVVPDSKVSVQGESTEPHTGSDAFLQQTGATTLASNGDTGQGVTVAVLDTGIDNLPDFAGRLIGGTDLTGGGNPFDDSYGHGTFVAGLIAGDGASSGGEYSGEAPGADLVSIKVAGADGTTDVATVIAGVQWAIANEATYHIKVLNLSLGFQPVTSTLLNPLDMAVEQAWNDGITVVTDAGNAGPFNGTILSPGDDPLVITVGAVDDLAQPSVAGDEMTDFSSAGPTAPDGWAKPDLVASGRSVVSLAAPGSTVYDANPSALIGTSNFVGSGTSFSAAITTGAVALMLEMHPSLTPDQVKARLLGTTYAGPVGNPFVDGHGILDADAAATTHQMNLRQSTFGLLPTLPGAEVSLAPTGDSADTWNAALWSGADLSSQHWDGPAWQGYSWSGSDWNGFTSSAWDSSAWDSSAWDSSAWDSSAWDSSAWDGSAWDSSAWDSSAWDSSAWN